MATLTVVIVLLYILHTVSIHAADYQCTEGQDCNIIFNTTQSVSQSTVFCPANYGCHITCTDPIPSSASDSYQICQNATILASQSSNITIQCNGFENCKNLKFIGSNSNTAIYCDGIHVCQFAQFEFRAAPLVSIYCNSDGSCASAEFNAISTEESRIHFNTIHAGDDADIYCGSICSVSSIDEQSNLMIYSTDVMRGDILQCDENCFIDSNINCDANYTTSCDITYTDNSYTCSECLNVLFSSYVTDIIVEFVTAQSDSNQYRQRMQHILYSTIIQLLTDPTDQFLKAVQTNCDCIRSIEEHVAILLVSKQFTEEKSSNSYSMMITITTDIEIVDTQMHKLVKDERFKSLLNINMAQYDDTFEIHAIDFVNAEVAANAKVIWWITAVVFAILGIILIIAVIGTIQMYKYDVTIYVTGVLLYGLYTWDFYSDILFAYEVAITYINTKDVIFGALFIGCLVFLVLPIVASIISLFRFQDKWKKDVSIGDRVTGWNRDWSTYLLLLTVFSGSSFAAVNIFNSRVFGHPLFCMGLSYRHLKKFENQRLYGVILSGNIPQIVIQALFVWRKQEILNQILILAFASSLLSIIVALIDIYNNKRLFGKYAEQYDYQTVLKVPVISHEVGEKQWKLCLATHRFNEVFSKILGVDKYAIEVDLPLPDQNGLVIIFSVRSIDVNPKQIMEAMTRAQNNGAMAKFIAEAWNLEEDPLLGRIKVDQIGKKIADLTDNAPIEAVNPLNSDAKTIEEQNAVNEVMIDPKRWDEHRSNTVDAKPYHMDKATRAKITQRKLMSQSQISQSHQSAKAETPKSVDTNHTISDISKFQNDKDAVAISDIPHNIAATQKQLHQKSQSELPRQRTGTHTKKMIEMMRNNKFANDDLVAKSSKMSTFVSKAPVSSRDHVQQFREQMQNSKYGAPSEPNLLLTHTKHVQNPYNNNNNVQNYAQSRSQMRHHHAQTYDQVPYNYYQVQQLPQSQAHQAPSGINLQSQFQQRGYQYASSAFHLNQNNYNLQQQNYAQNMQQFEENIHHNQEAAPVAVRKITDHKHESFLPPAPQQEVQKFVEWKTKRHLMDEEKKVKKRQSRDKKRLMIKEPNLSKIPSLNETDVNRKQWSQNNHYKKVNIKQNSGNTQFAQNLNRHKLQESDHMDGILHEMDASANQF